MKEPALRLYVCGNGRNMQYCVAHSLEQAEQTLKANCRIPDSDDIRIFWLKSGIGRMSMEECLQTFGVSRQTLHNWRNKGGADLQFYKTGLRKEKTAQLHKDIATLSHLPIAELSAMYNLGYRTVIRIAQEHGVELKRDRSLPSDELLLEKAAGKSWYELADLLNRPTQSLRTTLYKQRPHLIARLQEVMRRSAQAKDTVRAQMKRKISELGKKGVTPYAIAQQLKCDRKTVIAHLQKVGKERPNDFYPPFGNKRSLGSTVDGSNGGSPDQPR